MSELKLRPPKSGPFAAQDKLKSSPTVAEGGARRFRKPVRNAQNANEVALETSGGRGRDHGRDHPSRGPYANGARLRPTTCARASSSTHEPRAIGGARFPPAYFASRGVRQLGAGDGRLLRCAAGMILHHRREPTVQR
jgi:hypothetical protein